MSMSTCTGTMMSPGQQQHQWSEEETREFIGIRAELEKDFTALTKGKTKTKKKTLWEVVSARMRERGYRRTPDQCKCKWKNLLNRYKGKETSNPENGLQCPFFEELHAIFAERGKTMQRLLLESEAGSSLAKKRVKTLSDYRSLEDFSEEEDIEDHTDGEKPARSNPRKRKAEKTLLEKSSGAPITTDNSRSTSNAIQEMLEEFFQQQQMMEMQWREMMDRRAHERQLIEQEWCQTMEKLERERLMVEQAWREREEQRRMREEIRSERRDALMTALLNKLIRD